MASAAAAKLLTAEEFDLLPEPIEGGKMELVEGRVVTMAPVSAEHGELQVGICSALKSFVRKHRLGAVYVETGFRLRSRPDVVRSPDVSFVAAARLPDRATRRRGSLPLAPDLAVEVTSPTDRDNAVQRKVEDYLSAGVGRVWVVRPERQTVTVNRANGDAHLFHIGDALSSDDAGFESAGFELPLAELFAQD